MNVPARPECFGQMGPITCPCSAWNTRERNDCIASRYLWIAAQTVADLATNRARQDYVDLVGSIRGSAAAAALKAAAKELMAEKAAA